jgi:hypothetical protein
MVALLRAVATSASYRQLRPQLRRREPDDVWYDPALGWLLTFPLATSGREQLVLFVVSQPRPGERTEVLRAIVVSYDGAQAEVQRLDEG